MIYDELNDEYIIVDEDDLDLELRELFENSDGYYNPVDIDELECIFELVGIPTVVIIN